MVIQYIRSLIFNLVIYGGMLVLGILFFPFALFSREWAFRACFTWCRLARWSARWILGLKTEVRGTPPKGGVMVAAKHQSFLDIILIFGAMDRPRFIMKRELIYAPFLGVYALRIGSIPVNRGKRGAAIKKMKEVLTKSLAEPGQLIIYPQGTRVAPGVSKPYKVGTGVTYEALAQTCVPVAVNCGYFWPRRGILKKPGTAVVEFLEPIEAGLPVKAFMERLEIVVEENSDRLLEEAKANG